VGLIWCASSLTAKRFFYGKNKLIKFDSENALETFLFENREFVEDSIGLLAGELHRQVDFGCYGRVDFIHAAYVPDDIGPSIITVIELKNESIKASHAAQLCRYMTAIQEFIDGRFSDGDYMVNGVLIGPKTFPDLSDNCFLLQNISNVNCFEFSLCVDGLKFSLISEWRASGDFKTKEIKRILMGEEE